MEEEGRVIKTSGNIAKIEISPKSGCSHCEAKTLCSPSGNKLYIEAINERGAKVGDMVKVEMSPKIAIFSAFLLFVLPIIVLSIGFIVFLSFDKVGNLSIMGGIGLMVIYFLFLKKFDRRIAKIKKFKPVIKEILKEVQ